MASELKRCVVCGAGSHRSDWQGVEQPVCDSHTPAEVYSGSTEGVTQSLAEPQQGQPAQEQEASKEASATGFDLGKSWREAS